MLDVLGNISGRRERCDDALSHVASAATISTDCERGKTTSRQNDVPVATGETKIVLLLRTVVSLRRHQTVSPAPLHPAELLRPQALSSDPTTLFRQGSAHNCGSMPLSLIESSTQVENVPSGAESVPK